MRRQLLVLGVSLVTAGALVPIGSSRAESASGWAAHDAAVRAQHERGYLVGDVARYNALKSAADAASPGRRGVVTAPAVPATTPSAKPSWGGVSENDISPSDSTGAIGPTEYIEAINIAIGIYTRAGKTISTGDPASLTGTTHFSLSDPQILWDKDTNRFYYLYIDTGNDTFLWGFSKSSAPKTVSPADWCGYGANFGYGSNLPDYPKMGQTAHTLIVGANIYAGQTYIGSDLDFIQKPNAKGTITTCPNQPFKLSQAKQLLNPDGTPFASTPVPGVQSDAGTTAWVGTVPDATNSGAVGTTVGLFTVTENADQASDSVDNGTAITVAGYSPPPQAPQKGTNALLDTLDARLMHAVTDIDPSIAGGNHQALWTAHTVAGGAGSQVAWYEIDVLGKKLVQQGTISDPNLFILDGGISDDRAVNSGRFGSNMVAGFTTTSTSTYPADQSVVKVGTGAQSPLIMVHQSPGADNGFDCFIDPGRIVCRWGDYSGAVPDPVASSTATVGRVWMSGMDSIGGGPNPFAAEWSTWNWALQA